MIRAGMVGLGRWGRALVQASGPGPGEKREGGLAFIAAMTATPERAAGFCAEHGITLVDTYEALLYDPDIEAVVLATPHSQHYAQAMAAIAAGKHVFVEKPLTLDYRSASAVVEAARNKGRVLALGVARRFHPSIEALRRRVADGSLGAITAFVAQHTTSTAQFIAPGNWRAASAEAPAGAFTAVGFHVLDHMIEFGGPVRDVRCITSRVHPGPSDDTTTAMLRFSNGASGLIFCSVATATNFEFAVYGAGGLAEISRPDLSRFRFAPIARAAPSGVVPAMPDEVEEHRGFDMLRAELDAFARAIEDGSPYPVPVEDMLHGMAVFDALVASAPDGAVVAVRGR